MMKNKKNIIISISVISLVLLLVIVPTVLAYMFKKSNRVENSFSESVVMSEVSEEYDKSLNRKTSVKLKNTGNVDSYLRLKLVTYWVDANGDVVSKPSEMPSISYDTTNWLKDGDIYYYKEIVEPGESTPEFLSSGASIVLADTESYTVMGNPTPVYQVVEILSEAVQGNPKDAAEELWTNVSVDANGKLELK